MSDRLTHITTRSGDAGETGLADGTRVPKTDPRIHALGDVDELNSQLGVLLTHPVPEDIGRLLAQVQNDLFDLGSELAIPGSSLLKPEHVGRLDAAIAAYNALRSRASRCARPSTRWSSAKRTSPLPTGRRLEFPRCCCTCT